MSVATVLLQSVEVWCGGGGTMMDRAARTSQDLWDKGMESSFHLRQREEGGELQGFRLLSAAPSPHLLKRTISCQQIQAPNSGGQIWAVQPTGIHSCLNAYTEHRVHKGQKGKGGCCCHTMTCRFPLLIARCTSLQSSHIAEDNPTPPLRAGALILLGIWYWFCCWPCKHALTHKFKFLLQSFSGTLCCTYMSCYFSPPWKHCRMGHHLWGPIESDPYSNIFETWGLFGEEAPETTQQICCFSLKMPPQPIEYMAFPAINYNGPKDIMEQNIFGNPEYQYNTNFYFFYFLGGDIQVYRIYSVPFDLNPNNTIFTPCTPLIESACCIGLPNSGVPMILYPLSDDVFPWMTDSLRIML